MTVYYTTTNHLTGQSHTRKSVKHLSPIYTHAVWVKDMFGVYSCRGYCTSVDLAEIRAKKLCGAADWQEYSVIEPCGARVSLSKVDREFISKRGTAFA